MLNDYLQYFRNIHDKPNLSMLYRIKWAQLEDHMPLSGLRVLDFGSGFGVTANFLAGSNKVTAIEPNADMAEAREKTHDYTQLVGNYTLLKDFEDASFDLIICHNVLEFALERADIVGAFSRLLKPGGTLSIVKNNNDGRIMSKAVANDLEGALDLLNGGHIANTFGQVHIYNPNMLTQWGKGLIIKKHLSLQNFFGHQACSDEAKDDTWAHKVFELEMKVADLEPYKNISLFNHVLLTKDL